MEKINIAKLLKDCPKGMELNCTIFEDVTFEEVIDATYPIKIITNGSAEFLTEYGCVSYKDTAKCVIFPKGKTTWEEFQRPFRDGDIINIITENNNEYIAIFKDNVYKGIETYIDINIGNFKCSILDSLFYTDNIKYQRLATKEEKQKLFDAIKENSYKWNAETKTLENLVEPKFKVGDTITNGKVSITIGYIDDNYYYENSKNIAYTLSIKNQDDWRLDKFDITTLKPFDKVLVRNHNLDIWVPDFYGIKNTSNCEYEFNCVGSECNQCIPYNDDTKYLLGTNSDCNDYYKTWE